MTKRKPQSAPYLRHKRIVESDLPERLKHCLHVLAYHCNPKEQCWPSYRLIAEEMSVSRSSVRRYVAELIDLGILLKAARKRTSNLFILQWRVLTAMNRGRVTIATHRTYHKQGRATWERCRTCGKPMRTLKRAEEAQCRPCAQLAKQVTSANVVAMFPEAK